VLYDNGVEADRPPLLEKTGVGAHLLNPDSWLLNSNKIFIASQAQLAV